VFQWAKLARRQQLGSLTRDLTCSFWEFPPFPRPPVL